MLSCTAQFIMLYKMVTLTFESFLEEFRCDLIEMKAIDQYFSLEVLFAFQLNEIWNFNSSDFRCS